MRVSEDEFLARVGGAKRVFLLEPPYKRKYPPLGLAKISAFCRQRGISVEFGRKYCGQPADLICISSLFTYDRDVVHDAIRSCQMLAPNTPIIIGGIYASLMPSDVETSGAFAFPGYSQRLDEICPDYATDWKVDTPWDQFSFTFTSRGCPNKCAYCAVWRLEPAVWINPNWRDHIHNEKPCAMISDNNLSACPEQHISSLVGFLSEKRKKVVFDNGFDCKLMTADLASELARLRYTRCGMRLAFDRIEEDGVFQRAIEKLKLAGVPKSEIMAYVLFNFNDTPQQADYRMKECVKLGIRPYPQMFQPLNKTSRLNPFIGKYWTRRLASAFRHFWLMMGLFTKTTFEDYANGAGRERYRLSIQDWDAWHGNEVVADASRRGCAEGAGPAQAEERPDPVGGSPHVADPNVKRLEGRRVFKQEGSDQLLAWARSNAVEGIWGAEPAVGRVAHGIPERVDRLTALGNAVVPQVAEWIGRRIMEACGHD